MKASSAPPSPPASAVSQASERQIQPRNTCQPPAWTQMLQAIRVDQLSYVGLIPAGPHDTHRHG